MSRTRRKTDDVGRTWNRESLRTLPLRDDAPWYVSRPKDVYPLRGRKGRKRAAK